MPIWGYNMYMLRDRTFPKLYIDKTFQFISKSAAFNFIGHDINRITKQLYELVQFMSLLYKERLLSDSMEEGTNDTIE